MIRPVEKCDCLVTAEEYHKAVHTNCFTDYDGFGYYSDGKIAYTTELAIPSETAEHGLKPGYTHVVWFNK